MYDFIFMLNSNNTAVISCSTLFKEKPLNYSYFPNNNTITMITFLTINMGNIFLVIFTSTIKIDQKVHSVILAGVTFSLTKP